jgi:flagellin
LIKTADGALSEIHSILGRQRELLVRAANDICSDDDRQAIEDELDALADEMDDVFDKTQFNGTKIFKGKDTIISGPNTTTTANTVTDLDETTSNTKTEIVWIDKGTTPADSSDTLPEKENVKYWSTFEETETENSLNDAGYMLYDENSIYTTYESKETYETIVDKEYTAQPADNKYTRLVKPSIMVGNNGYINVKNEAGNLALSCAMSQLGVKIDGKVVSYDLYKSSYKKTTKVLDADGNDVMTSFDLGNGITISQQVTLSNDQYVITFGYSNNSGETHSIDLRFAFDTLNTKTTAENGDGGSTYTLVNEYASIGISAGGAIDSALGDISDLYNVWDDSKVHTGDTVSSHTGVGYWWSAQDVTDGSSATAGAVNYGPIELLKEPYELKTTTSVHHTKETTVTEDTTTTTILPQYLNIQSGANAGERTVIRLWDLSSGNLHYSVGKHEDISAFHAADSLNHIDRVVKKVSAIRSYYGAMQNRLETTYNSNVNYSENLTSAESAIRDADMAEEITKNAKENILIQAAQSMLAHANTTNDGVLQLLQ